MGAYHFIEPRDVRTLDGPQGDLALTLFYDSTDVPRFCEIVAQLEQEKFDFNGLHSGGWTIGKVALWKGSYDTLNALDSAGYNFSLDTDALAFSKTRWNGMFHRTVALAAYKYDPSTIVPPIKDEYLTEAKEMKRPGLRGIDGSFHWRLD